MLVMLVSVFAAVAVASHVSLLDQHGYSGPVSTPQRISFKQCGGGLVHEVSVRALDPFASHTTDESSPMEFHYGSSYDITITFTSPKKALRPRSGLTATQHNDEGEMESSYAYSGQAFDACRYTACPLRANTFSTYTYRFETLRSEFDWLTFNVTTGVAGPSVFCVGFAATSKDSPPNRVEESAEPHVQALVIQ